MSGPAGLDAVPRVPHGQTAQRLTWRFLPPEVRDLVEGRLGAAVADAESRDGGFTPGFASVLTGEDGSRLFVKAASRAAQALAASSYSEEARKRALLGDAIPAPRLLWTHEDDAWVILAFEAVDAAPPRRPWRPDELDRALDLAEEIAEATASVPEALELRPLVEDIPSLLTSWSLVDADWPHREEAAELAAAFAGLPDPRFVHADLRDDNVLLLDDGGALACDWNWPALGPVWLDTVDLLVSAHGDGLDADDLLSRRALTRDADPDAIDSWLAAICGFMLASTSRPAPPSSPHLRTHATWYAEASWSWLARRRGWTAAPRRRARP